MAWASEVALWNSKRLTVWLSKDLMDPGSAVLCWWGEFCSHDERGLAAVPLTHPGIPQGRWCVPRRRHHSVALFSLEPSASPAVKWSSVQWDRKDTLGQFGNINQHLQPNHEQAIWGSAHRNLFKLKSTVTWLRWLNNSYRSYTLLLWCFLLSYTFSWMEVKDHQATSFFHDQPLSVYLL